MHDPWLDRLSEYLDDELNAADRRALDAHLAECDVCRATLAELHGVVAAARSVENREPERELWPTIAAAIGAAAAPDIAPGRTSRRRRFSFTVPQLAAAAVLLMAASGAAVWFFAQGGSGADEQISGTIVHTSSEPAAAGVLVSAPGAADPTFAATVAQLEQTLDQQRAALDPATVEVIERSLVTIDGAMADARTALEADPGNMYLHRQLENTMQKKIDVLRRATRLGRAGT